VRSWSRPDLPALPGTGRVPRLHDTSTGELRATRVVDGRVGLYVCGITPYDATHLGHASTYLAFDALVRTWRDAGLEVTTVQNTTDVDDPLLERATATGVPWRELAAQQTELFRSDMQHLAVLPPDHYVAVTEVVSDVADAVADLLDRGLAYRVPTAEAADDDVYFDVRLAEERTTWHLGQESRYDDAAMRTAFAERGGDPGRAGKRDPFDPLLWRAARTDEPSWPTVLGHGRPGWHIECTVIAEQHLETPFSVAGGGSDLVFPHHEMSVAHGVALTGRPHADLHAHGGMVAYQGEKMSKSLGNLVKVSELVAAGHDPRAVRLAVTAHHWRSDWEWTAADLEAAESRLGAWRAWAAGAAGTSGDGDATETALLRELRTALADDLDVPRALRAVDAAVGRASGPASAVDVDAVATLLGVDLRA